MDIVRIVKIEYLDEGSCIVGVERVGQQSIDAYPLSQYCYRPGWLMHFQQPDLDTIWQLTKRQPTVSLLKRMVSYTVVKYQTLKQSLQAWETDMRHSLSQLGDHFEEW